MGAYHAGIRVATAYPGTPSTEILEFIARFDDIYAEWSTNEKSAYETALGVSYIGKRTLICMKHVGLNVSADPFMNSAITGVNGGLVVVVADDPGMHSSQNEQDSRYYADFARIACFEPSNQQEAYDMTRDAFNMSEKFKIPVMLRLVTRLSHSRANIKTKPPVNQNKINIPENYRAWTLLPVNARVQFEKLVKLQPELLEYSDNSRYNKLVIEPESKIGVIASGIAYNYFMENAKDLKLSYLKIGTYPLPRKKILQLVENSEKIIVMEEGYPFIEKQVKEVIYPVEKEICGKLSGLLPITGELNPDVVRKAMSLRLNRNPDIDTSNVVIKRLPRFCDGCPHENTFDALDKVREIYPDIKVFSDIGCYTLGALRNPPSIETCVCMGASTGMAKGAANCGLKHSVGVIGDSTFLHAGIPTLLKAAAENTPMTLIILDNSITAMTGGQDTPITGTQIDRLIKGLGIPEEHIKIINPVRKNLEININIIKNEVEYPGLSVIIARRECIQLLKKKKDRYKI